MLGTPLFIAMETVMAMTLLKNIGNPLIRHPIIRNPFIRVIRTVTLYGTLQDQVQTARPHIRGRVDGTEMEVGRLEVWGVWNGAVWVALAVS